VDPQTPATRVPWIGLRKTSIPASTGQLMPKCRTPLPANSSSILAIRSVSASFVNEDALAHEFTEHDAIGDRGVFQKVEPFGVSECGSINQPHTEPVVTSGKETVKQLRVPSSLVVVKVILARYPIKTRPRSLFESRNFVINNRVKSSRSNGGGEAELMPKTDVWSVARSVRQCSVPNSPTGGTI